MTESRRSKLEQDLDILHICRSPSSLYVILRRANIPYMLVKEKVDSLEKRGLVVSTVEGRHRKVVTTSKGLAILEVARQLSEMLAV